MKRPAIKAIEIELELRRRRKQQPEPVALMDGQEVPQKDVYASLEAQIAAIRLEEKLAATAYIPGVNFDEDDERAHGGNERPVRFF